MNFVHIEISQFPLLLLKMLIDLFAERRDASLDVVYEDFV
jgi:hypothetical protein